MREQHELVDFLKSATREMAEDYKRILRRATQDPGTAGDQGEETWKILLQNWLPPYYHIETKGRIVGVDGIASPQVDIVVLHPFYPVALRRTKLYPAAGVVAAFECKTLVKADHVLNAFRTAAAIKNLTKCNLGDPYSEMMSPISYGLLAHTHKWRKDPKEKMFEKIEEGELMHVNRPIELLDYICISDLGSWNVFKQPISTDFEVIDGIPHGKFNPGPTSGYFFDDPSLYSDQGDEKVLNYTAIGSFLSNFLRRLSFFDPNFEPFAGYFRTVVGTIGKGKLRQWPVGTISIDALYKYISNMEAEQKKFRFV